MKNRVAVTALAAALCLPALFLAFSAAGQGKDELWEVSTQMNAPGLPAGMGAMTTQVCQDRSDPKKQAVQGADMENCRITDMKQSGNKVTMTVACPDSKAVIEQTYNAARTEFKGSMRMTSRDGDMTMNMSGRKLGSCDARAAQKKMDDQRAGMQKQIDQQQAYIKQQRDEQIRQCAAAVETMDAGKLGIVAQCRQHPELCKAMAGDPAQKPVIAACQERQAEYCKRYQTEDGFFKAKGDEAAAQMCGLEAEKVRASLCPRAVQSESLAFLARFCLAESRPLAEKHCAGRDYTSMRAGGKADKYTDFCLAYMSNASLAERGSPRQPSSSGQGSVLDNPADAVQQGINEGINRLKGLFGR